VHIAYNLLYIQVGRALNIWKSGENPKDNETKTLESFSADKYGDDLIPCKTENRKVQRQRLRRATFFVPTIQKFTNAYWQDLIETARDYLSEFKTKRKRASSSASSGLVTAVEEETICDPDGAYVMDIGSDIE
jgi:hypothetical protein